MDIEQTFSALEMISEALVAAVSPELLGRRDRLIEHIAMLAKESVPSQDRARAAARLQRIRDTGERARECLKQSRIDDLSALDRLRQVSSTVAAPQPDRTLDCTG